MRFGLLILLRFMGVGVGQRRRGGGGCGRRAVRVSEGGE